MAKLEIDVPEGMKAVISFVPEREEEVAVPVWDLSINRIIKKNRPRVSKPQVTNAIHSNKWLDALGAA